MLRSRTVQVNRSSRRPELLVTLARGQRQPMHQQILQALREGIRSGRLRPGGVVPSTRTLAADLGVSRGVVVQAYDQLIAECYLVSTQRGATTVSDAISAPHPEPAEAESQGLEFDFRPGEPDLRAFPREAWRRAFREALASVEPTQLGYNDPRGVLQLRSAMVDYLSRARGVVATANQIVVCTGCAQGLSVAARVLRTQGVRRIALESPGHPEIRHIIEEAGLVTVPVPVDDHGLSVDCLERKRVEAVVVSPAHQNPLGAVLSPARRQQLLAWASRVSGLVIEDDYDAEYRYDRAAVGALQGLAPERVIYVGSASKILAPALRLGWLVLAGGLLERAIEVKRRVDNGCPALEQVTYAQFLRNGELDRHLRRMRNHYRSRRDALLEAMSRHCPGWTARGAAAGLHCVAEVPDSVDVRRLVEQSAARSVGLYPLSGYTGRPPIPHGLVFGYARLNEREIAEGVRRIGRVLAGAVR
jgi:GntR family transcriptional regulator/MocR family aminotransferase